LGANLSNQSSILEVTNLTKRFGAFDAVSGLSFSVPKGSIVGFLGPNGAGKSTSLKSIVGVHKPDEGDIRLFGGPLSQSALSKVGYLPEERGLYRKMTALATITYFSRLKGMSGGNARRQAKRLLEENGLGEWAAKRVSSLSKGMAQKVQILCAIAHEPDFVILDEPFSGLDPVNQADLEALVRGIVARGGSVLFSTHVMQHAERLCEGIVLLAQGRKVFDGTVKAALATLQAEAIVEVAPGFAFAEAMKAHGIEVFSGDEEGHFRVSTPGKDGVAKVLAACLATSAPLLRFEPARASLHDAFVKLVGDAVAPTRGA
jgi:ABC-2 type transport system ATP-binding protein